MAYQQWNHQHHYQAIPESRPLMIQPWQHEFGCPIPRPRSFSLGSRPTGTDLMEVSTKRVFNPPIILPVDSNHNYCYKSSNNRRHSKSSRKCRWAILFFMLLVVSSLTVWGWWKLRRPTNVVVDLPTPPAQAQQPPYQQQHPLPPPPVAQIPPGPQQQYYNQPQYQQHAPPPYNYQQQQQQQQYNPHHGQPQQHHAPPPHYGQQQYQQHHMQQQQQQHSPKPEMGHRGEPVPRNSWMMEHANNKPAIPNQENDIRHQQQYRQPQFQQQPPHVQQPYVQPHIQQPPYMQQQQQPPQKVEPPVLLSRHEERAKARNQARTMNPIKNSTKIEDDDIWEKSETTKLVESIAGIKLRLEPAQFSYTESVFGSDGTLFLTSFEDGEEVTVEVVEDA